METTILTKDGLLNRSISRLKEYPRHCRHCDYPLFELDKYIILVDEKPYHKKCVAIEARRVIQIAKDSESLEPEKTPDRI